MQKFPRVSVLMPVYNTAPFLKEAVDSILNQTFKDFELIVLNDCSPDNSEEILDAYSDDRIVRYRGQHNVGLANILNVGIQLARGEFIARMDSDDISLPQRFEKQVHYLDNYPQIDLVSAGMKRFGDSEVVISHQTDIEEVKFSALFYSPILHSSSMWRKESFLKRNLFYRQERVPVEDYDLWTRALTSGVVLVNIPEVLYLYRTHATQVTRVNKDWSNAKTIQFEYIKSIFPDISEKNMDDISHLMKINDAHDFKRVCENLENENDKAGYFDKKRLHRRLWRYYQAKLYNQMKSNGIEWNHVCELRLPQIFKILVDKINRQNKLYILLWTNI